MGISMDKELLRCPNCHGKNAKYYGPCDRDHEWKCLDCGRLFDNVGIPTEQFTDFVRKHKLRWYGVRFGNSSPQHFITDETGIHIINYLLDAGHKFDFPSFSLFVGDELKEIPKEYSPKS